METGKNLKRQRLGLEDPGEQIASFGNPLRHCPDREVLRLIIPQVSPVHRG